MSEVPHNNSNALQGWSNGTRGRKAAVLLVVLLGVTMLAVLLWWQNHKNIVQTDNARVAANIVDISSRVGGTLETLLVKEQDHVQKGQLLAELDAVTYRNTLSQAEAGLETAQASYAKLPSEVKSMYTLLTRAEEGLHNAETGVKVKALACNDARRNAEQAQQLFNQGALSREQLEAAQSRLAAAELALESAQTEAASARASLADAEAKRESMQKTGAAIYLAQLKQAQAAVDTARYNLNQASLHAPSQGTILRLPVQPGENVSPGQTIATICDLNESWVVANLEEKVINRIKVGQRADIMIDAYPGEVFEGKVEGIAGAAQSVFALIPTENTSGNYTKVVQRLPVKISVKNRNLILKPGMSAQVKIYTR